VPTGSAQRSSWGSTAICSGCPQTVLMDERCAFFFSLMGDYENEAEEIRYTAASAPAANTATPAEHSMSGMAAPTIAQPAGSGSTSRTSTAVDTLPSPIERTQQWTIRRHLVPANWREPKNDLRHIFLSAIW